MRRENHLYGTIVLGLLLVIVGGLPLLAQNGKLKVSVHPPEAYIFVDGQAMGQANHTLALSPGNHRVDLVNYGYKSVTRDVSISSGATENIDANLEPLTDTVSGPWGCITVEGAHRDAILLNGKTPDYFVGHGDEFNHEWWWKQELIVPPGTHQLTVMQQGKEIWSGTVEVPANQRVVLDIPKGVRKTVPWPRGEKLTSSPRFQAGTASARVAVAKPTAQLSSQRQQINCGDGAQLKWNATDAAHVDLTPIGPVAMSGEQLVQPKQATTYELKSSGPGGIATATSTVNVNNGIQAQLALSPSEIRYKKVGDKVVEQSGSALNWSVSNAATVSIDPFGSVDPSGNREIQLMPKKTDAGAVDETVTYTLTASNVCGATETRTAILHILGSIEAESVLAMRSVYFPTDIPRPNRMKAGLVASQQQTLKSLAEGFKTYLAAHPDAHVMLTGFADQRGPHSYNKALSERRAEVAKTFLIEQGIAPEKIETEAYGEEKNLDTNAVKQMLSENPDATEQMREKALQKLTTTVYAHNRRVDMKLTTTGQGSVRHYPFAAEDFSMLVKRGGEAKGVVVLAAEKEKIEN
jgi:outer membrane protein OmpA-like peptidoglycan-associated protein